MQHKLIQWRDAILNTSYVSRQAVDKTAIEIIYALNSLVNTDRQYPNDGSWP